MDDPYIQFGFDGEKPRPADPIALEFSCLAIDMLAAHKRFTEAVSKVPDYTGQWSAEDYYAKQEEDFNRSVDNLWNFVKENVK